MTTNVIVQPRITKITRIDGRVTRLVRSIAVSVDGGGVSQAYVDNGDAATLVSANAYTDSSLSDKADLVGGFVPASQLPSFVDDVLEGHLIDMTTFDDLFNDPYVPESGKIYLDITTNLQYRWGGSSYVVLNPSLALGETSSTAYRGDRGKIAYDHSQATGNPHGTSFSDLLNQSALFNLVYSAYVIGSNTAILASDTLGQMLGKLQAQVDSKEPTITATTSADYYRGDKTWRSFATDALGTVLTGLSTATATAITATDTVLTAFGKLQAQVNNKLNSDANAVSATKLATARNINGVAFDGTANITVADSTKEPTITAGTVSQYIKGDKSLGATATANTADTLVARDASGNFAASTITASLNGTASNVATNANLTGIVTSIGNATAIADKAIPLAKLADGTAGNILTYSATGVIAAVATGTAAQVLTSNGAGNAPTFQAATGGGGTVPPIVKQFSAYQFGGL